MFAGHAAPRSESDRLGARCSTLAAAGLAMVALGWLWDVQFPVIKKLWTSSFVLVACGYASLLLALFHLVIDTWGLASLGRSHSSGSA